MTGVTTAVWREVLEDVRRRRPDLARAWFGELVPVRLDRGMLEIGARNEAQSRYLEGRCRSAFVESAQAVLGRLVTVEFVVADNPPSSTCNAGEPDARDRPAAELNHEFTFDLFAVGACNRMAHAAALAAADDPGGTYNPLLIHGPRGLGKTHLLQALCRRAAERDAARICRYIPADEFIAEFTASLESESLHAFRSKYRDADLLALDDVGAFAGRDRSQEEFFHTINTLLAANRQVAVSADRPPSEIAGLEPRLVSRFSAGLVATLDAPCLETRLAILKIKARHRCIEAPEETLRQLAQRITSGGGELTARLARLDESARKTGGRITPDLVVETAQ